MISKRIKLCLVMLVGFFCFQPVFQTFAEDADMQEKYGYYLMDVPSGAKEMFFAENKKKWEDSIYSERRMLLQRWELTLQQDEQRKDRLKYELDRQKQTEDLKEKVKEQEKQRRLQEQRAAAQAKEERKKQEKNRIKLKHAELFKKMDALKNTQQSRNAGR